MVHTKMMYIHNKRSKKEKKTVRNVSITIYPSMESIMEKENRDCIFIIHIVNINGNFYSFLLCRYSSFNLLLFL